MKLSEQIRARRKSGRKAKDGATNLVRVCCLLTQEQIDKAKIIGGGEMGTGIRTAINKTGLLAGIEHKPQ